jgi:HEAT repeat protein
MSSAALVFLLAATSLERVPAPPKEAPHADTAAEEQVLKSAGIVTTAEGLLAFFRNRTPHPVDKGRLDALLKQFQEKAPAGREQAAAELVSIGYPAVGPLRQLALNGDDEDISKSARKCLDLIEGPGSSALVEAAARLLAVRRPAGAVAVLVAYLPFADTDATVSEIENALKAMGARDGKPDPALTAALTSPVPVCRTTAARVLCEIGSAADRTAVAALLEDAKPTVRLRAALALIEHHENSAVPVLIDLLAILPAEGRKEAEDFLTQFAGEWAVAGPTGADRFSGRVRREAWSAWWRATDGKALLEELKARTLTDEEHDQALQQIQQLDDPAAAVREKAFTDLFSRGIRVAPLLRQASAGPQHRLAAAAKRCLDAIERDGPQPFPECAPRLLGLRRPEGTIEALLAYLPYSESDTMTDEIIDLLAAIGCPERQPAAAITAALGDRSPARRSAAAAIIARRGSGEHLGGVRKLLHDPDPTVRLRTALALGARGDKEAVPTLIALLGELPEEQAFEVEEHLRRLAGERAPTVYIGGDRAARGPVVEAWRGWWRDNSGDVDLAALGTTARDSGHLLVIEQSGPRGTGRILEVSPSGKMRLELENVLNPLDAQVLPGRRLLVLEQANRVTERDRDGKMIWQKNAVNIFGCRRLPNGHTFIMGRQFLSVVDAKGNDVFTHHLPGTWALAGERWRDGSMSYVTYQGQYVRIDASGKEIKRFQVPFPQAFGVNGGAVLPNDHVLISLPNPGELLEYNPDGKVVWKASVHMPGVPTRLPNGRTLVPTYNQSALTEIDREGRIVSEKKDLPYRPYRVYRR